MGKKHLKVIKIKDYSNSSGCVRIDEMLMENVKRYKKKKVPGALLLVLLENGQVDWHIAQLTNQELLWVLENAKAELFINRFKE